MLSPVVQTSKAFLGAAFNMFACRNFTKEQGSFAVNAFSMTIKIRESRKSLKLLAGSSLALVTAFMSVHVLPLREAVSAF